MRIYLDDYRVPRDKSWTVVKNYDEFVSMITECFEFIEEIQFDHDLGDMSIMEYYKNTSKTYSINYDNIRPEMTGYDCAKFLVDFYMNNGYTKEQFPFVYTHSANPVGRANIEGYLNGFFKVKGINRLCEYRVIEHNLRNTLDMNSKIWTPDESRDTE